MKKNKMKVGSFDPAKTTERRMIMELKCKDCGHSEIVGVVPVKILLGRNGEILEDDYTKVLGECPMPDYYYCAKCESENIQKS